MTQSTKKWDVIPVERNADILAAADLRFHLQRLSDATGDMEIFQVIPEAHGWMIVMRSKA